MKKVFAVALLALALFALPSGANDAGWNLSGRMRMDANYVDNGTDASGNMYLGEAKLNIERRFGENGDSLLFAVVRKKLTSEEMEMFQFYARVPFVWGTYLTAGKAGFTFLDSRFGYTTPGAARYSTRGWFDNKPIEMLRIVKILGLAWAGNISGTTTRTKGSRGTTSPQAGWGPIINFHRALPCTEFSITKRQT